jgi:hypothetical protein
MPPIRHIRALNLQLQQHTGHAFCDMPKLKRRQVIQLLATMSNKPKEINPIEGPEGDANRGSQGKKIVQKVFDRS